MNDSLKQKCNQPEYYTSIKYMLHSLPTERMDEAILEIAEINPYLAAISYLGSEEDSDFRKTMIDLLWDKYTSLGQVFKKTQQDKFVCLLRIWMSFYLLRDDRSQVIRKVIMRQPMLFWVGLSDAEKNTAIEIFTQANDYEILSRIMPYMDAKNAEGAFEENSYQIVKHYYAEKDYKNLLLAIDSFGLYSMLPSIGFSAEKFFLSDEIERWSSVKADQNYVLIVGKLLSIYLVNGGNTEELLKRADKIKSDRLKKNFIAIINKFRTGSSLLISMDYEEIWDSEKNGINKPYAFYCQPHAEVWLKGVCGHSWKKEIPSSKKIKKPQCPICKNTPDTNESICMDGSVDVAAISCTCVKYPKHFLVYTWGITAKGKCVPLGAYVFYGKQVLWKHVLENIKKCVINLPSIVVLYDCLDGFSCWYDYYPNTNFFIRIPQILSGKRSKLDQKGKDSYKLLLNNFWQSKENFDKELDALGPELMDIANTIRENYDLLTGIYVLPEKCRGMIKRMDYVNYSIYATPLFAKRKKAAHLLDYIREELQNFYFNKSIVKEMEQWRSEMDDSSVLAANRQLQLEIWYRMDCLSVKRAKTKNDYKRCIAILEKLEGYKDSEELIQYCKDRI